MLVTAHLLDLMVCITHPRRPAWSWVEWSHSTSISKFLPYSGSVCVAVDVNSAGQSHPAHPPPPAGGASCLQGILKEA